MSKRISFSEQIKNEIMESDWTKEQWGILFYSFLRTNGSFKGSKYVVTTTLFQWEKKFNELFKIFYGLEIKPVKMQKIMKYEIGDPDFLEKFSGEVADLFIGSNVGIKAYIAGIYVGKGWISDPNSRFYHFEVRVRHLQHSLDVQEAFDSLGVRTNTIKKNQWFYTYVKKSADIARIIVLLNAPHSNMEFENARIERDYIATYTKMKSIEVYNAKKQKSVADKQIKAIKFLMDNKKMSGLNDEQIKLFELRIEKPAFSLSELQLDYNFKYQNVVSKSTINNWLNKAVTLAEMYGGNND